VLRLVRLGLGGAWGSGRQYISWIHEQDFLRAIDHLIWDEKIDGVVNLAAPAPLPNVEFLCALREAWGTSLGLPASRWMLEAGAVLLQTETELLLKSRRVIPGILPQHGFEFRFPAWPQAAQDLVRRWRSASRTT
jgi:NAD dependent epimerase/dehydratase family enzyme